MRLILQGTLNPYEHGECYVTRVRLSATYYDQASQIKNLSNQLTSPWMYYYLKFDIKTSLMNLKCPR